MIYKQLFLLIDQAVLDVILLLWLQCFCLQECTVSSHDTRALGALHGPLCYNCHGIAQPNACSDIKVCSIGEVCMLHKMVSSAGQVSFEASCQSEMICNAIGQMGFLQIGKRDDVKCHVCCKTDFCNNACGRVLATTPMSQAATLDNRVTCLSCSLMEDPGKCRHHVTCDHGQICMTRMTGLSFTGTFQFQSSCASRDVCKAMSAPNPTHQSKSAQTFCVTCCESDLCNDHCGTHTTMTSSVTTTTQTTTKTTFSPTSASTGPTCFSCTSMSNPGDCSHVTTCNPGEVCTVGETGNHDSQTRLYEATCQDKNVCEKYAALLNHHFGAGNFCKLCCDTDLCNDHCPTSTVQLTTMTPPPTITHSYLRCFHCDVMNDPNGCRTTEMCGQGHVCMFQEIVSTDPSIHQYTSTCKSTQVCEYYKQNMNIVATRTGRDYCFDCCNSDLCNKGCTHHIGPSITHAPKTATAPPSTVSTKVLHCLSCSSLDDPIRCSHPVRCLPGEVCMVQSIGKVHGVEKYSSSCQDKQVCHSNTMLGLAGSGFCHTCCESDLCNTRCDPGITQAPLVTTSKHLHATTPPHNQQGPLECFDCDMMPRPDGCTRTTICGQEEVCDSVVKLMNLNHGGQSHVFCTYCCNTTRCNSHCEGHTTSHVTTGHVTAPTTPKPHVDGHWSDWSGWSSCSKTCGSNGHQSRSRLCNNPAPQHGGHHCQGPSVEQKSCHSAACLVDGHWSDWSGWSSCSKTCGSNSHKSRSRLCNNPAPQHGGHHCQGPSLMTIICTAPACPVDGHWSGWSGWSSCSKTCGSNGHKSRSRLCSNPAPQHNGHNCQGLNEEQKSCHSEACPASGGPLECFDCGLMYNPGDCPNTDICGDGEICENVVRLLHNEMSSAGHMFCTYCCETSRCNNHCDMSTLSQHTSLPPPTTSPPHKTTSPLTPGEKCQLDQYSFVASAGLCFRIYETIVTYTQATSTCHLDNGTLAIIDDVMKWNLIFFELTIHDMVSGKSLYIGGHDDSHNGHYTWANGESIVYNHWATGEPRAVTNHHHRPCVIINGTDLSWHTDDCRTKRPFICTKHVHEQY